MSDDGDEAGVLPEPAAIADLGAIGDGRSVALIGDHGSVDWWALPRLDSPPVCAALLDPQRGGRVSLWPTDEVRAVERSYLPDTNLLRTVVTTGTGRVQLTDCLNSGNAGALPWTELARRVEGLDGEVEVGLIVVPGSGLGQWAPWRDAPRRRLGDGVDARPVLHAGEVTLGVLVPEGAQVEPHPTETRATWRVAAGQRTTCAVVGTEGAPLYLPELASVDARMDLTASSWEHWARQVEWDGENRARVVRSQLALKLLMAADTGAIAAAATTSLPEWIGGRKNWDYRFAWVRDASFTIDAMAVCGLEEETHAAVSWLLRAIRRHGPRLHVMYGLDGDLPSASWHPAVPGYRDSRPVIVGNDASMQRQLGVYGDLFSTVETWVARGHVLDVATRRELADLADRCADTWRRDDAGIWELQDERAYTISKMNCWRALDVAARLAERGHLSEPGPRWRQQADAVRSWVEQHCWSERKQAYVFHAGTDDLDAAVLLGARTGFDRGPRMAATVRAVTDELSVGPLLYRYTGVDREEGAFVACSYWLVEALAWTGDQERAERLMADLDPLVRGSLGLMSEMVDPATGAQLGNVPQALSHLAFVNAAATLRATRSAAARSGYRRA